MVYNIKLYKKWFLGSFSHKSDAIAIASLRSGCAGLWCKLCFLGLCLVILCLLLRSSLGARLGGTGRGERIHTQHQVKLLKGYQTQGMLWAKEGTKEVYSEALRVMY